MRIERKSPGATAGRGSVQKSQAAQGGKAFSVRTGQPGEAEPAKARPLDRAGAAIVDSVDALLAVQTQSSADGDIEHSIRYGNDILGRLEQLRESLLFGRLSPENLRALVSALGQRPRRTDPDLDRIIDEIDLRARVELAKIGEFR